jgi:GNAT superfamily N-acetyltransferase
MGDAKPATTIRRATGADVAELARLRWEFKLEEEPAAPDAGARRAFLSECETWLRTRLDGGWKAWVAEPDGQIVGHVFVSVVERMPSPTGIDAPIGYVTNFYVAPRYRDRGIGASLLEAVNDYAKGRTAMHLDRVAFGTQRSPLPASRVRPRQRATGAAPHQRMTTLCPPGAGFVDEVLRPPENVA